MSDDLWADEQARAEIYSEVFRYEVLDGEEPIDPWLHDIAKLGRLQEAYEASPIEGRKLARIAYRILFPRLGKAGALAVIFSAGDRSYPVKLIAHRRTEKTELHPSAAKAAQWVSSATKREQIGGATLLAYRECGKIEVAYEMVSEGAISGRDYVGEPDGGWPKPGTVKAYYQRHKIECFERGFADMRRVSSLLDGHHRTNNLLLLSDFPASAKST